MHPRERDDGPPRRRAVAWVAGVLIAAALFAAAARTYWLDSGWVYPQPLQLSVVFPVGSPGANEPLVAIGRFEAADFLTIKYLDATTAVLSYDSWGVGAVESAPFALHAGTRRAIEIEMPSLALFWEGGREDKRLIRVKLDGREIFRDTVSYHPRFTHQVYLAWNPIGGTPAAAFRGELNRADGTPLQGQTTSRAASATFLTIGERLSWLSRFYRWPLVLALFLSAGIGFGAFRLVSRWSDGAKTTSERQSRRAAVTAHVPFLIVGLASVSLFAATMTGGTFRLIYPDSFGNFYDYQAASLLAGHWDVPPAALPNEAFIVGGKYYGYFGPTPALLRLPCVLLHVGFGALTRLYLLGYYAGCLVASYLLLGHATRSLRGPAARPSRWVVGLITASVGLGSTLFFLGGRAYIYHEAILCGAMFTVWSVYFALRHLAEPSRRRWIGALGCGLLAIHARPPSGLFALCMLGTVALAHLLRSRRPVATQGDATPSNASVVPSRERTRHLGIAALAALAILSFNGLSYLKFGTFDGAPLRYHMQYTPERLARFDGKNFHGSNLRHNIAAYLFAPHFLLRRDFPWFYIGGESRVYPEAKLDIEEPTLAVPYAMPALFGIGALGAAGALLFAPLARRPLIVLAIAVIPMALALFTAIATSHRYTGDLCPFLIASGAWALAAWEGTGRRSRRAFLAIGTLLLVVSIPSTLAITLHHQGAVVWGTPEYVRHNYETLRLRIDHWFGVR